MKYSYCTDGEFFYGEFTTPEEAAEAAFRDTPNLDSVEVGENHKSPASFYVSAESILEDIAQRASEECGEVADDWLLDLIQNGEKIAEFEKLVGDWIEANEPPTFWRIDNTRTITRAEMIAAGRLLEGKSA